MRQVFAKILGFLFMKLVGWTITFICSFKFRRRWHWPRQSWLLNRIRLDGRMKERKNLSGSGSYAAFSVSASLVPRVVKYVRNQEAHHKRMSFEEEFVARLKEHGVAFDRTFIFG